MKSLLKLRALRWHIRLSKHVKIDLSKVIGKAGKQGNFVSLIAEREFIYNPLLVY